MVYNLKQRIFILQTYHQTKSPVLTRRAFNKKYGTKKGPGKQTVLNIFRKFNKTGSIGDLQKSGRPKIEYENDLLSTLENSYLISPTKSIRRKSSEFGINPSSFYRLIKDKLNLKPYKLIFKHELFEKDKIRRSLFAHRMIEKLKKEPETINKIVFTDEAWFTLRGEVNQKIFRTGLKTIQVKEMCCKKLGLEKR